MRQAQLVVLVEVEEGLAAIPAGRLQLLVVDRERRPLGAGVEAQHDGRGERPGLRGVVAYAGQWHF
jgi:hypothetical protein